MKVCVRIYGSEMPFKGQDRIAAWDGRRWRRAAEVQVRPTYHGWGSSVTSYIHNTLSIIPVDVRRDLAEGGARLHSPTRSRSRIDKSKKEAAEGAAAGSPSSIIPSMANFKASYSSPYGARATSGAVRF